MDAILEPPGLTRASIRDYLMLTKPVVVLLLLVTTFAAMIIAAGEMPDWRLIVWTMIGGAFTAGGASAINQVIDRNVDRQMQRTRKRPIPQGKIGSQQAIKFGLTLAVLGLSALVLFVNPLCALLAFTGFIYYVVIYSLLLKAKTPQNIVVGGGAGAIPPLVGWAAATGSLTLPAFFLFAVVFFWTPPHFWALALLKRRDYARAGIPMFPVVYGEGETRSQIMLYTIQLVALTLLLPLADLGGWMFLLIAIVLGTGLISVAWRLWRYGGNQLAWKMYRYSSSYLAFIFVALVLDTLLVG